MPPSGNETSAGVDDTLSDSDIALLCDIGGSFLSALGAEKLARLRRLIERGFVEQASSAGGTPARYQLTAKATHALAERGVGLNES